MVNVKPIIFLLILISFFFPFIVSASDVTVTATVDKTEATLDDQINLSVTVNGTQKISEPVLPPFKDFQIVSSGTSTEMRIVNGSMSTSKSFNYILMPQKEGVFTIGQIQVEIKGRVYKTNPITIKILSQGKESSKFSESKDYFLTAEVNNTNPYVNEQIVYTIRFYRKVPVSEATLEKPGFEGFLVEEFGKEKEFTKIVNGQQYLVYETKIALFPLRSGRLEIPSVRLKFEVVRKSKSRGFFDDPFFNDPFFGGGRLEPKLLTSKAIEIKVRPLPERNKPSDFNNLVGKFEITSNLTKGKIKVGESTTLNLEISGRGNIKNIPEPPLGESSDFKVYSDQPKIEIHQDGDSLAGKKIFKKAIIPLKPGILTIPPVKISFFNPETERYEVASSKEITFTSLPSSEEEKLHLVENLSGLGEKESIKVLQKDILPISTSISSLKDQRLNLYNPVYSVFFLMPVLSYLSCLIYKRRRDRYRMDIKFARNKKAFGDARKKLKWIKSLSEKDKDDFYTVLSKTIREYLGDKLNVSGSALTPAEIKEQLETAGINKQSVEDVKTFLEKLEYEKFVSRGISPNEKEALLKSGEELLKRLEKDFR